MKSKFLYLAVLTLLAVLVVWVYGPGDATSENPVAGTLFLPAIAQQINKVNKVEVISAGNNTVATLVKTGDGWQFEQMGAYQANWVRLQALLAGLAQARVVEPKTDKPEYYARLGVEDIETAVAGSVLVRISIGDQSTGILVGHQASGRPGQYVRLQGVAASALVDRKFDVSTEPLDWAEASIIDINASEVAEVEIIHPQGERLLVTRISADQIDFDFVGLPQDREINSSWAVNSLGSVFSMLDMETVQTADSVDWTEAVRMRMLMFSGVEILADMIAGGDGFLLRLSAGHPAADVVKSRAGADDDSIEQQAIEKRAAIEVAETVEKINRRVSGWAYGISEQKYAAMSKKPEDLLKPLESP